MKTTLEIPDELFREAKAAAAQLGIPLRELVTEAITEKLRNGAAHNPKPWMACVGELRSLKKESARIDRIIEDEFGRVDLQDWQ